MSDGYIEMDAKWISSEINSWRCGSLSTEVYCERYRSDAM
jgi:hypothetical protein